MSDSKKYGTRKYLDYNEWMKLPYKRQMEELNIISASVNRSLTSIEKAAARYGFDPELSHALSYVKGVLGTSRITSDKQQDDPTTSYQVAYHVIHDIKANTAKGFIREVSDKRKILFSALERNRKNLEKLRIHELKAIKEGRDIVQTVGEDILSSSDLKAATKSISFDAGSIKKVVINLGGTSRTIDLNSNDMLSTIGHMINMLKAAAEEMGYSYGKDEKDRNEVVKALSRYLFSTKNYSVEDAMNLALNDILHSTKTHTSSVATTGGRVKKFSHIKLSDRSSGSSGSHSGKVSVGGASVGTGSSKDSHSGKVKTSSATRDIGGRIRERL